MATTLPTLAQLPTSSQAIDLEKGGQSGEKCWITEQNDEIKTVRIERDMQGVTVEGYRTLGVVSTFIAGVEAQCFSLVPEGANSDKGLVQAISALLIIGLLLSSFGAVTALLAARWFDLLKGEEIALLNHRWACARAGFSRPPTNSTKRDSGLADKFEYTHDGDLPSDSIREQVYACKRDTRNWILAKVIFFPFYFILFGFYSFIVGIVIYSWRFQALVTAIVSTTIVVLGSLVVVCLHLKFETMGALNRMSFSRPGL